MPIIYNGTDYYYRKNLQGDIIAILNTSGSKVVEYTYNAWGEVLGVSNTLPRAGDYLPLFFWEIRSVTLKTNVLHSIEK